MTLLTREQIIAVDDLPRRTVEVPEWGGEVLVARVTAKERAELEAWLYNPKTTPAERQVQYTARMVAVCLVDESGRRLFEGEEGVQALLGKSGLALRRLADVAEELNAFLQSSAEKLEKNSDASPRGDSSST